MNYYGNNSYYMQDLQTMRDRIDSQLKALQPQAITKGVNMEDDYRDYRNDYRNYRDDDYRSYRRNYRDYDMRGGRRNYRSQDYYEELEMVVDDIREHYRTLEDISEMANNQQEKNMIMKVAQAEKENYHQLKQLMNKSM